MIAKQYIEHRIKENLTQFFFYLFQSKKRYWCTSSILNSHVNGRKNRTNLKLIYFGIVSPYNRSKIYTDRYHTC